MALSSNSMPRKRGIPRGDAFGYPIAPGEVVYTGGLTCVNSSGQAQRVQTSGSVAFVGIATNNISNVGQSAAGANIVAAFDTFALTVPGATAANINAPVYATDDNTLTLTAPGSGFTAVIGYLVGIDNGQTYVKIGAY